MRLAAPPEAGLAVRIPVTVTDPASAIKRAARKTEGRKRAKFFRRGEPRLNFRGQFRRNHFVGIDTQNPGLPRLCGGGIYLRDISFPGFAKNFGPAFRPNLGGAVIYIAIDDQNNFAGPVADALQSAADARGLIARDNAKRRSEVSACS